MKKRKEYSYRNTCRYKILSDPMKVLLELVALNKKKRDKIYLTYTEICKRLEKLIPADNINIAIDILFDLQEITVKDYESNGYYVRGYAPSTELVQESMTQLFLETPYQSLKRD